VENWSVDIDTWVVDREQCAVSLLAYIAQKNGMLFIFQSNHVAQLRHRHWDFCNIWYPCPTATHS